MAASGAEAIALMRQQPAFDRDGIAVFRIHEPAKRALRADDAVARNDECDAVGAARLSDRARRRADGARDFAIGP
jgi:hypothetical protein